MDFLSVGDVRRVLAWMQSTGFRFSNTSADSCGPRFQPRYPVVKEDLLVLTRLSLTMCCLTGTVYTRMYRRLVHLL
jgi:hypothetical protein